VTQPQGDLPDWQAFTAPPCLAASTGDQPANTSFAIVTSGSPFRIWGVWLRLSIATSSAYTGGVLGWEGKVLDGAGNILLDLMVHVIAANQINHAELAIPVPGFTPGFGGGSYNIQGITPATLTNVFARWAAGAFYSIP
jgi:hypothetical protein